MNLSRGGASYGTGCRRACAGDCRYTFVATKDDAADFRRRSLVQFGTIVEAMVAEGAFHPTTPKLNAAPKALKGEARVVELVAVKR